VIHYKLRIFNGQHLMYFTSDGTRQSDLFRTDLFAMCSMKNGFWNTKVVELQPSDRFC